MDFLESLPSCCTIVDTPEIDGRIIRLTAEADNETHVFPLGLPECDAFNACYRTESCWMDVQIGSDLGEMPVETQFLLLKSGDLYTTIVPLLDGRFRAMLHPYEGGIGVRVHSGDSQTVGRCFDIVYVNSGRDPYVLVRNTAADIAKKLGTVKLVKEKQIPAFADVLGWCSYNACYADVTHDKLKTVLERWQANGQTMGFLLIDVGWQETGGEDGRYLTGFGSDAKKFPGGMSATSVMVKSLGVEQLLVWMTYAGYWQGADPESFPEYGVKVREGRTLSYLVEDPEAEQDDDATVGPNFLPLRLREGTGLPDDWDGYFGDYCKSLAASGVDGVKVDAMTWVEMFGEGVGGRVEAMKSMIRSLERATHAHMNKQLLSCSSCANDYILQALDANVARSSPDFQPKQPESHGRHLMTNAHTSIWMGEFLMPDWDMFQTGHDSGAFHAAARAISGGPVYTTDEIGEDDFDILHRLALPNGRLPRCATHALPTPDCLFADCRKDAKLLKIFNHNPCGAVVGAFNCRWEAGEPITDEISLAGIPGLGGDEFAVYSFNEDSVKLVKDDESLELTLDEMEFELLTITPINDGFAPIGLVNLYNAGGGIESGGTIDGQFTVRLMSGGGFLAWCERKPRSVTVEDESVPFEYEHATNALRVQVDATDSCNMAIAL